MTDDFIRTHTHGDGAGSEDDGARDIHPSVENIKADLRDVWEGLEQRAGGRIWMTAQEWCDAGRRLSPHLASVRVDSVRRRCDELHNDDGWVHRIELPVHEQTRPGKTLYLTHGYLVTHGVETPDGGRRYLGSLLFRGDDCDYTTVMGRPAPTPLPPLTNSASSLVDGGFLFAEPALQAKWEKMIGHRSD